MVLVACGHRLRVEAEGHLRVGVAHLRHDIRRVTPRRDQQRAVRAAQRMQRQTVRECVRPAAARWPFARPTAPVPGTGSPSVIRAARPIKQVDLRRGDVSVVGRAASPATQGLVAVRGRGGFEERKRQAEMIGQRLFGAAGYRFEDTRGAPLTVVRQAVPLGGGVGRRR